MFIPLFATDVGFHGRWDDTIIAVAAVLLAWSVIWLKAIRPAKDRIVNFFEDVGSIKALMEQEPILSDIVAAFKPNGGSSLPQTIKRIEQKVDQGASDIAALSELRSQDQLHFRNIEQQLEQVVLYGATNSNTSITEEAEAAAAKVPPVEKET